jgi:hypothetical protein
MFGGADPGAADTSMTYTRPTEPKPAAPQAAGKPRMTKTIIAHTAAATHPFNCVPHSFFASQSWFSLGFATTTVKGVPLHDALCGV